MISKIPTNRNPDGGMTRLMRGETGCIPVQCATPLNCVIKLRDKYMNWYVSCILPGHQDREETDCLI